MSCVLIAVGAWRREPYRISCESVESARRQARGLARKTGVVRLVLRVDGCPDEVLKGADAPAPEDVPEEGSC